MNGHPISPFDTIIEPPDSPINSPGFYMLKTINYRLQERLMKEKLAPPKKKFDFFFRGIVLSHPWGALGPKKHFF